MARKHKKREEADIKTLMVGWALVDGGNGLSKSCGQGGTACKNQDDMRTEGPYGLNYNANNAIPFWRSKLRKRSNKLQFSKVNRDFNQNSHKI